MDNTIEGKGFRFATDIIRLTHRLRTEKDEHTLSAKLFESGTGIGAHIVEAQQMQNRGDFVIRMRMALDSATDTLYWLRLLQATGSLPEEECSALCATCTELQKVLVNITSAARG